MKEITFRKLKADELQIKCTDTKYKGTATLLIFKDARVDMRVLDETLGKMNWCKDYKELDGKIYCGVGIKDENGNFVFKWDCGTEGNFEAEKSEASDAFKRACFNWSVGRELYDTPKIKINCPDSYYYNDKLTMTFTVKSIEWDGDKLVDLIIIDRYGKEVYNFKNGNEQPAESKPADNKSISNKDKLIKFCKDTKPTLAEDKVEILNRFYKYYESKMDSWTGNFVPETLYKKWVERERSAA